MSIVLARERQLYADVFDGIEQYSDHSPGAQYVQLFQDMADIAVGAFKGSVLDAGCGTGKGALALQQAGFNVTLCDFVDGRVPAAKVHTLPFRPIDTLWADLRPLGWHDYVYCTDVLEHIPPEFTMLVIARLLAVARKGVFLSISLVPDQFGFVMGELLHKTVQPFAWWRDRLNALGAVQECRDFINVGVYYVRPRGC